MHAYARISMGIYSSYSRKLEYDDYNWAMWQEAVRWVVIGGVVVGGSFGMWRRMRSEYPEEEVLTLCLLLTLAGVAGAGMVKWVGWWGVILGMTGVMAGYCRVKGWDTWEWADLVGLVSLGLGWILVLAAGAGVGLAAAVLAGWVAVRLTQGYYRSFKWYRSGRVGLVGLVSVVWWGLIEIGVETFTPRTIYWVGLTVAQWLAVAVIVAATAAVYIRSGQTVATNIWRKITIKNRG